MTKAEKLEMAKKNHKYAIELIAELEQKLTDMRRSLNDRKQEINKIKGIQPPRKRSGYNKDELIWHFNSSNDR